MKNNHLGGCYNKDIDNGSYVPIVWDAIIKKYNIKSVIDIGCGYAQSLKYFLDNGINGIGIEGWDEAINETYCKGKIVKHDYTLGEYIPELCFDLGWSCEFVEHIESQYINNFIATFKRCKYVAMTHAIIGQSGHHHVNCQNSGYWIEKITKNNFKYLKEDSIEFRNLLCGMDYGRYVNSTLMIFQYREEK